jgi:hypothetical protein
MWMSRCLVLCVMALVGFVACPLHAETSAAAPDPMNFLRGAPGGRMGASTRGTESPSDVPARSVSAPSLKPDVDAKKVAGSGNPGDAAVRQK